MTQVKLRPHHLLCALGFEGKGYSEKFIQEFQAVVDLLRGPQGDDTEILLVSGDDAICRHCPNLTQHLCKQENVVRTLDQSHARALDVHVGERLTWVQAKNCLKKK